MNLVHSGQHNLCWTKLSWWKIVRSRHEIFEIHRFQWGRLSTWSEFSTVTEISTIEISERKTRVLKPFLRYSVLDNGFFCPWLLARVERRICTCLQRRKCLQNHTNFVKYANHEVTEFWACKKWARTVLAFLSLQK